jgi:cytochrome c-type biogenesis protein
MTIAPLTVAFTAGVVSFLSPCVLPLIPGYVAYLAGTSATTGSRRRREIFLNSLCFVLGFGLVFALLGVLLNTLLSAIAYDVSIWLSRVGGVLIIIFGLYLSDLLKISWLSREHKINVRSKFQSRYLTSFVFGAAFAAGWTPCVGAVLGAILGLAASQPALAFSLLLMYSAGFGIPFLLVGLFTAPAGALIARYGERAVWVNRAFGVVLILLGILIFTQTLNRLANFELLNRLLLQ